MVERERYLVEETDIPPKVHLVMVRVKFVSITDLILHAAAYIDDAIRHILGGPRQHYAL